MASCGLRIHYRTKGEHGFHVHQFWDNTQDCTSAGPHFNLLPKTHGGPKIKRDMLETWATGLLVKMGWLTSKDSMFALSRDHSIIGRTMVVHEKPDDFSKGGNDENKKTGNSGSHLASRVIGIAQLTFSRTKSES
ncbi:superoxide dismutase [Cu-Zn]-like [Pteropus vampyrus]|uniref:Superoxide dismutase [Cu-Zn]-like n=1 Tax=Pteropus vampyrus TaxID=132908 RepID=A0A6P6CI60_PTEVA|nr:superoxide dismutase [Cu-Zn]-like [Pteropus vampyrus]